jgi:VacB/RNase II family 3'-5' exoribonuclease
MSNHSRHLDLPAIAKQAMIARGFQIHLLPEAQRQLVAEVEPSFTNLGIRDLSSWLWSSIDNDDSRDLDQIEYAVREAKGTRIYVGIADVDWFVPRSSPLDQSAAVNTTSVYTGVEIFPMLPEKLSTDLSSLNEGENRLAVVVEMLVADDGTVTESLVYPAIVRNRAQLTYEGVAAWLDKTPGHTDVDARILKKIGANSELQEQLRMQDAAAQLLSERRHEAGALTFHTEELQPVMADGKVVELGVRRRNRASVLIEDFMVAANQATATFLDRSGLPSVRRVVRVPKRWDKIVAVAAALGFTLPGEPDGVSLEAFLKQQQKSRPAQFADLSFTIIKLLGRGEYVVKLPGQESPGHFGLAVENYAHSTAPNRRYPDLLTQRLLKAVFAHKSSPYSNDELQTLAKHCTDKEDDANKVERFIRKCAAAVLLGSRIGQEFDATVSGVTSDGEWVRLVAPPVEGKLEGRVPHLDVGQKVRVRLVHTNPERGFIDFQLLQ